jgi:hypothetical protein
MGRRDKPGDDGLFGEIDLGVAMLSQALPPALPLDAGETPADHVYPNNLAALGAK